MCDIYRVFQKVMSKWNMVYSIMGSKSYKELRVRIIIGTVTQKQENKHYTKTSILQKKLIQVQNTKKSVTTQNKCLKYAPLVAMQVSSWHCMKSRTCSNRPGISRTCAITSAICTMRSVSNGMDVSYTRHLRYSQW